MRRHGQSKERRSNWQVCFKDRGSRTRWIFIYLGIDASSCFSEATDFLPLALFLAHTRLEFLRRITDRRLFRQYREAGSVEGRPALALLMCNTVRRSSPLFSHQTSPSFAGTDRNWGGGEGVGECVCVVVVRGGQSLFLQLKSTAETERRVRQSGTWGCLRSVVISEAAGCFEYNLRNKKGEMVPDRGGGYTRPSSQTHCQIIHQL